MSATYPSIRLLSLAAALGLLAAAPAGATTVTYSPGYGDSPGTEPEESCSRYMQCPPPTLDVTAGPGETNAISVRYENGAVVVRDASAPVTTSSPACSAQEDGSVRCPGGLLTVALRDGDDRAELGGGISGEVLGGAGADTLIGANSMDTLDGGEGADTLRGADGDDRLVDGEALAAPDVLDGGAGTDRLVFGERADAITAKLTPTEQSAGAEGEGNSVMAIEGLDGGAGDDHLTLAPGVIGASGLAGHAGDDRLTGAGQLLGGLGADVLQGSAENDFLDGGPGRDEIHGGAGDDMLYGGSAADILLGGRGRDVLQGEAGDDRLYGGPGRDSFAAGAGRDFVFSRDVNREFVNCGPGRDRARSDRRDRRRACERR